ncbi:MAG: nuclear transport factor 2 family protein [Ferruginibacter sp.]|nr:nuclear transport factor 2 family protein [Chitinophagaceae bacterium]
MKKIHVGILFILLAVQSCQQKETLTREEVLAAIHRFDEGWKNKNAGTVDSILSPSYIYFTQSGGTFKRTSLVETAGSPEYALDTVSRSEFYVQLYENTAVVSTRWRGKGTYKGVYFDEDQRCSITVVKVDDKVQILSEHCTPVKLNRVFH